MVKRIQSAFEDKLSVLVAEEIKDTWHDPVKFGLMLENLAFALSYSLCIGYRADAKVIDKAELVLEHYVQQQIQNLLPVAKKWIEDDQAYYDGK